MAQNLRLEFFGFGFLLCVNEDFLNYNIQNSFLLLSVIPSSVTYKNIKIFIFYFSGFLDTFTFARFPVTFNLLYKQTSFKRIFKIAFTIHFSIFAGTSCSANWNTPV